jgi:hypothetical protein
MQYDIKHLLDLGSVLLEQDGREKDYAKRGSLRGGSVGWMTDDRSACAGTCPRRAWARMKGYYLEDNSSKQPMFQGGHLSEEGVLELLKHSWKGSVKREEEIPISWKTKNGILVTGRPDMVLFTPQGIPVHGLELKLVSSMWTALSVIQKPKTEHVMQAAHYARILNLDWTIVYVNRTNWALLSDFAMKKVPKQGEPGSQYVEYEERNKNIKDKEGNQKKIKFIEGKAMLPFHHTFPIRWNENDEVEVKVGDEWQPSFISWSGIECFYNFVAEMDATGQCGPAPSVVDVFGNAEGYSGCKYCPLKEECGGKEIPLDKFKGICESHSARIIAQQNAACAPF